MIIMNEKLLKDYARLTAVMGANVEKGEEVWIYAQTDQPHFVKLVVEECYKLGAKKVLVNFSNDEISRLNYKYQTVSELSKVASYSLAKYKYMAKKCPTRIHIISEDPDAFKGINQNKIIKSNIKVGMKIKPFRNAIDGKHKWCIVAVPSVNWAKKVFKGLSEEEAVNKLWDAILFTSRVDGNDPVENWRKHNEFLVNQRRKLQNLNLKTLVYKSELGTDFRVDLIEGINWGGGIEKTNLGKTYNPNIPSEEVFTSPKAGSCEGIVVASKPLSYNGELIEDFSIEFKDGKVVSVKARKGQKILEGMVKMDEGASMLGEIALVPYDSPIRESNILFYNTLFDENAACHLALGMGFKECLPDGDKLTNEEAKLRGINDSIIHVDFMIGTRELSITGIDRNGKEIPIFVHGNWAI